MSTATGQKTTWKIDTAHSHVGFSVRHMMITTVKGRFTGVEGEIQLDEENPADSYVRVTMDAATVDTGIGQRDDHLRSADFFDVANFPQLVFESRRISVVGDDRYRVVGDLTIRGVTREVEVDVEEEGRGVDPWGQTRVGFTGTTKFDRRDFGLTWNQAIEAGGVLVSDEVKVTIDVSAIRS
jgi:polyisoprenoid-binding protein YceI